MTYAKNTKFKKSTLIITSAIIGSLGIIAFAPAAYAFGPGSGQNNKWQQKFNQLHQQAHAQGQMQKPNAGIRGQAMGANGSFISFACSNDGVKRLETIFVNVSEKFNLNSEQQDLLNDLKTSALSAQTGYADTCSNPRVDRATVNNANIITRLEVQSHNMNAMASAIDEVLPSLKAFFDSLSDEQKAAMKMQGRDMRNQGMQAGSMQGFGKRNN